VECGTVDQAERSIAHLKKTMKKADRTVVSQNNEKLKKS
jgi:hypothetical protein